MALTIPNIESITNGSNGYDFQSIPDATDWAAAAGAASGTFVISGMRVTTGIAPLSVNVAAGKYAIAGITYSFAGTTSLLISGPSASDRRDIVTINTTTASVTAGTPCGSIGWTRNTPAFPPVKPAIPANNCLLAEVAILSNILSISSINIVDKTTIGNPMLTNLLGEQYVIPTIPNTATGDHPPIELSVANNTFSASTTLIAAPGAGLRLRLFSLQMSCGSAGMCGVLSNAGGGTTYLAAFGVSSASSSIPAQGFPMPTNTGLGYFLTAGTGSATMCVYYTVETV